MWFQHYMVEAAWPRLCLAFCRGSVTNSLARDWEQNSDTSSAVWEMVPDRIRGFSLLGAPTVLNILDRSSSGRGSSPLEILAWFSSCLFWTQRVFSWYCFSTRFWCLLNLMDSWLSSSTASIMALSWVSRVWAVPRSRHWVLPADPASPMAEH